ncbi:lipocalin-like domain-containing protein [Flavobacterium branchiicola]|uniref:Lipocalin family protein n=1 Tax=Flavobacterium branchiicola TaxID=1114875 RepID=A0ABV9PJN0_9FLAO|nr:lipocalin family protein [Flavobacterium branchiicola]MBS7256369.1 lipocalin family protein [Flavobacterium branchiicola]
MKHNGKFLAAIFVMALLTACKKSDDKQIQDKNNEPTKMVESNHFSKEQLVGDWVQPNPINNKEVQGVSLLENGTAKSINMATLQYEKWWMDNEELFLVAKSIGNRQQSLDTLPYKIIKLNKSNLFIKYNDGNDQVVEEYSKK